MKLSRLGAGVTLAIVAVTACLISLETACITTDEACGNAGVKNGTCKLGPTCPSGSVEIPISDPADECPASNTPPSYICCEPSSAAGSGAGATTTTTTTTKDSGAGPG